MRKGVSVIFVLVMLLSATQFTIAIHYCGGSVADSKVSLSGKLASCGMESTERNLPSPINGLASHCCDNQIATVGIINIFTLPSVITPANFHFIQIVFNEPVNPALDYYPGSLFLYTSSDPPGRLLTSSVSLPDLCVFRI